MSIITAARDAAQQAQSRFDDACRPHYPDGRWGAYRAIECGQSVPAAVSQALDAYHSATQTFYLLRDGSGGMLGERKPVKVFSPLGGLVDAT